MSRTVVNFVRNGRRESPPPTMVGPHFHHYGLVGQSRAIGEVVRLIELVSTSCSTVLITGETGTGKELVARAVHHRSARRSMPFISVNCAAIPETLLESDLFGHVRGAFTDATVTKRGRFSLANRGSVFLDEIGATSAALQSKLLRVLQEREFEPLGAERTEHVDVRVIAATNRDLRQLVDEDRFQEDLFYRLHVVPIIVPPLRERIEDIPLLVGYFVDKHATRNGKSIDALEDGVIDVLQNYHWPGNVRELINIVRQMMIRLELNETMIDVRHIPDEVRASDADEQLELGGLAGIGLDKLEKEAIRQTLAMTGGNREQTAVMLGIGERTLYRKLKEYGLR